MERIADSSKYQAKFVMMSKGKKGATMAQFFAQYPKLTPNQVRRMVYACVTDKTLRTEGSKAMRRYFATS